jgi:hypothetical protein
MLKIVRVDDVLAQALAELDAEMARCGLVRGLPEWLTVGSVMADVESCASDECPLCGHGQLAFYPAHRALPDGTGKRFVIWHICPECGHWEQF